MPLFEHKPGALDQAAPLQSRELPEGLAPCDGLPESRMSRRGKRDSSRCASCRRPSSSRKCRQPWKTSTFACQPFRIPISVNVVRERETVSASRHTIYVRVSGTIFPPPPTSGTRPSARRKCRSVLGVHPGRRRSRTGWVRITRGLPGLVSPRPRAAVVLHVSPPAPHFLKVLAAGVAVRP